MSERPRLLDDLAGMAGGAVSALVGVREEAESMIRARLDEALRRLNLVRREEFEVVVIMAATARDAQERAETRLAALEAKLESFSRPPSGGGPGMIV